jgi:uridine phosphorylase
MPFPNYVGKFRGNPLIRAEKFWQYKKELGIYPEIDPPKGVIFTFQTKLMNYIIDHYPVRKVDHIFGEFYVLETDNGNIGITGNIGIGAPVTAILLEELSSFGIKNFISIGTAGALKRDLKLGSIIVCDKAIRDEGTSYHYLEGEKYAYPSENLKQTIVKTIEKLGKDYTLGTSWTTDAVFRETVKEIDHYKVEGVSTVDMEASAIFAVAKYLNVEAASIFTISDHIGEKEWKPYFHLTEEHLHTLFQIALETMKAI